MNPINAHPVRYCISVVPSEEALLRSTVALRGAGWVSTNSRPHQLHVQLCIVRKTFYRYGQPSGWLPFLHEMAAPIFWSPPPPPVLLMSEAWYWLKRILHNGREGGREGRGGGGGGRSRSLIVDPHGFIQPILCVHDTIFDPIFFVCYSCPEECYWWGQASRASQTIQLPLQNSAQFTQLWVINFQLLLSWRLHRWKTRLCYRLVFNLCNASYHPNWVHALKCLIFLHTTHWFEPEYYTVSILLRCENCLITLTLLPLKT